jgi:hypothetical protein
MGRINWLYIVITTLFMIGAAYCGWQIYHHGAEFARLRNEYAATLNLEERLFSLSNWFFPEEEWLPKKTIVERLAADWQMAERNMLQYTYVLMSLIFIYALSVWLIWRQPGKTMIYRGGVILNVAIVCLGIGIAVPMMEIIAYSHNLTVKMDHSIASFVFGDARIFEGDTVYFYQNKSVLQLIAILFESGNLVVGIAILLFSVVIPSFKLMATFFILFVPNPRRVYRLKQFLSLIGKWSMADVFVASCFLAYLSFYNMGSGVQTDAITLPGLYFFLVYVLLGLVSTRVADLVFKKKVAALKG